MARVHTVLPVRSHVRVRLSTPRGFCLLLWRLPL
jgi:hypothetical protein